MHDGFHVEHLAVGIFFVREAHNPPRSRQSIIYYPVDATLHLKIVNIIYTRVSKALAHPGRDV